MKHSMKKEFAGAFIVLMGGLIFICWLVNIVFLEHYYISEKKDSIMNAYKIVNEATNEEYMMTEEFQILLQNELAKSNISILVVDQNFHTVITSVNEKNILGQRLMENIFKENDRKKEEIIKKTDRYTLSRSKDRYLNNEYLELWGSLDSGNIFILRSPIESIRESAAVANRFLAYTGCTIALLGVLIIWLMTDRITKPILKLADISKRMSQMDFEVKYEGNEKNEIGILGQNINTLSDKLEETISALKSANIELQQDIEKKNELDAMRKEFLSNVSHELKTPIALIQGYAEGLQEEIHEDQKSREFYCEVIIDEAAKMNRMVKKLLSLNELEFGNHTLTMERFDIIALIKGVLQSSEIILRQKGITVHLNETDPVYVWADEYDIEEVVSNYISNAINHVDKNNMIEITVQKREQDNIRISIYNSGEQIPKEDLEKVWIKFYKVDKARTREYGGSGIGLSIVKAIMDKHQHSYGVENKEHGVEFWFELDGK